MEEVASISEQKKKEALKQARKRYQIDYKGIVLNTVVSILSSASATAVTSFLTEVPAGQLPAVAAGIFIAQVLPKLFIEVHKSYFRNKARREAYSEGLLNDDFDSKGKSQNILISACDSASYY
jgi:Na+/glutamate symporter